MQSEQEPCCHKAAKIIARELGVRIDHPGTRLLAKALAAQADEPARNPVVIARKGDRCRSNRDETRANAGVRHPNEPSERTRKHAESRRTG